MWCGLHCSECFGPHFVLGHLDLGPKQKVGIRVGRSEKVDFYKGTFRAQTGTIVHSRNYLVLFRPNYVLVLL